MPAWPGGPCPNCAVDMPARLVRCRECRTLLNNDLKPARIEIPEFQPLQVLDSFIELPPRGFYVSCPHCDRKLKISRSCHGKSVQCTACRGSFEFSLRDERIATLGIYVICPYCHKRLRMSAKQLGRKFACVRCGEKIRLISEEMGVLNSR